MYKSGKYVIKGQIISIRDGEKKIRKGFIYGYMILSVQVGTDLYSILVDTLKVNKYGFLPRNGQYIQAEGLKAPAHDGIHDFSMSHLTYLKHIEPNKNKII
jgi:hypothetical protein